MKIFYLQPRFAFEHKGLLVVEETDTLEDDERPSKRGRSGLPKSQGRKRNGTDFWLQVDHWFEAAKEERGSDFTSEAWRT